MVFYYSSAAGSNNMRIASLNLCTDSMLFELAEPSQIVSVTALSQDEALSHHVELALTIPANRGLAEEVIALAPDLVLTGSYTSTGTTALLKRLGYRVMTFQPATNLSEFRTSFVRLAAAIGAQNKADQLLREMDLAIASIVRRDRALWPRAIIYRPNGYSPGQRSLANEMLTIAGIANLATEFNIEYGGFVPIERLVVANPDFVILADRTKRFPALADMVLAHPALRSSGAPAFVKGRSRSIKLSEKYWACGGTFIAAAATHLAASVAK